MILFAAFAFLVFAQAAVTRNGAQSAADAAALAAAQDSRSELLDRLVSLPPDRDEWADWLTGANLVETGAEQAAEDLAAQNRSRVVEFAPAGVNGRPGYRVAVETNYTVGASIIPGTESRRGKAEAMAVLEPRCRVGDEEGDEEIVLECDGKGPLTIKLKDLVREDLPDAADLFAIHLAK